jgi:hypothetical protein
MKRYRGAEMVEPGLFLNVRQLSFTSMQERGPLPGGGGDVYRQVPTPVLLLVGPLLGLAFVVFLPFIGFAVVARLLVAQAARLAVEATRAAARVLRPGWEPSLAFLSRSTPVYSRYARSVHGKALVAEGNLDVPACADCHAHHQIESPGTAQFWLGSPATCIRCHGDRKLMERYGISPDVVTSYLSDFHGVTASLARVSPAATPQIVVTCVDCHGVHDIASPALAGAEAMKASVAAACSRCHEGASPAFPAAWLSHYEPSLQHAPLVFLVGLFYKAFIPFVVIGLVLHVLLDLYRMSAGR